MAVVHKMFIMISLLGMCASELVTKMLPSDEFKSCPTCDVDYCPKSIQECSHGLIKDECGCCKDGVCLLFEKEKCFNLKLFKNITETDFTKFSVCGEYMECVLRMDVKAGEVPESTCKCIETEVCCGKDNMTYHSICKLKEAGTELDHTGACTTLPEIVSQPEVPSSFEHEEFSLKCEAKGFPVPDIHWEFEGLNGVFKSLPGDDPSIVVHNRGGPEPFTVSSWVMIDSLREIDAGTYICVAKNNQGITRSGITVHLSKKNP